MMETATIIENGRRQMVCLPKRFRFSGSEVLMQRRGDAVMLLPKEASWQTFLNGINSFTEDFFEQE